MHICFITSEFPKKGFPHGGVGTFIATLSSKLIEKDVKVTIVGLNYTQEDEEETINGVKVYRLCSRKIKGFGWYFNSQIIARKIQQVHELTPIDFVETTELGLAFLPKIKGIRYVIRMNGGHHFFAQAENRTTERWKVFQEKQSFKKADHILAVSNYVADTTRKLLKLGNRPIQIIYNPIDTNHFYQSDNNKIKKHTIFFAGSIVEKKGIRQLIQALEYLVKDFSDIRLIIAGRFGNVPGTNKPYQPILERVVTDKIQSHVTFLGVVPNHEIPNNIEKAQICCYPSHMEAMPLAWLEVLAMGKVFLGSNTGPGPEAVLNNVTGFLVNPHNPMEIAEKIRYIFEHYDEATQMASKARERVLEEFDADIIVGKNIVFYKSIL